MTIDWKALCAELADALDNNRQCLLDDCRLTHPLADRARAALAAEADGPAVPDGREPASVVGEPSDEELLELWQGWNLGWDPQKGMVLMPHPAEYARAVLARWGHQPAPPAEGEVGELVAALTSQNRWAHLTGLQLTRAADLLEQRHPAPVPVSEHPWKRDRWCDDEDRCWCFNQWDLQWELENYTSGAHWCEWMLPFNALPLPQEEVE